MKHVSAGGRLSEE